MKRKKLIVLLLVLAMLAATVPVSAISTDILPPFAREAAAVDVLGVTDTADAADGSAGNVARVGDNEFATLADAIKYASSGDTIQLIGDINTDQFYAVQKPLTLDLNGHTLSSSSQYAAIYIRNGDLTIIDNSLNQTGMIAGTNVKTSAYAIRMDSGKLTVKAGTINNSNTGCYAVSCAAGTVMTIDGGKITAVGCGIKAKGTLTINGGTVQGDAEGIIAYAGSATTINGGTVSSKGYGIYLLGTLTINGGTVHSDSYGILAKENTMLTMNGGAVTAGAKISSEDDPDAPATTIGNAFGIYCQGNLTINNGLVKSGGTAISGNGSHHGTVYIINGGTIEGALGIYHPQNGELYINRGTIIGHITGVEIRAGTVVVNGGTIQGSGIPTESDPNSSGSTTVGAGIAVVQHTTKLTTTLTVNGGTILGYTPIYEKNIQHNPPEAIEKVSIYLKGGRYTTLNDGVYAVYSEDRTGFITGGTYDGKKKNEYIADGYIKKDNHNETYTVTKPYTVIDTGRVPGAEVKLDDLLDNPGIDEEPDATYRVVVSEAPEADVTAINEVIAANDDRHAEKAVFEIWVEKTDKNGTARDFSANIHDQAVTITLADAPINPDDVNVYYVAEDGSGVKLDSITVSGHKVSFTAPMLSTYAITYGAKKDQAETITSKVGVVFSPVTPGGNQYYITLKPLDPNRKLNRYMSADIAFKNACSASIDYVIEPIAYMKASIISEKEDSRAYHFEMDGINYSDVSCDYGEGVTVGIITFNGSGTLDFSVDTAYPTAEHTVNTVTAANAADDTAHHNYTVKDKTLVVNELVEETASAALRPDEMGTITDTLYPLVKNLTVNIAFNHAVQNRAADYQNMTLTISGSDLTANKVIKLGTEPVKENTTAAVEFDADACAYKIVFFGELAQDAVYNVKLEGAGYRTARCTVTMTDHKTLNFWNNVKDTAEAIEAGKTTGAVTANFLAGDIVRDNRINVYDLSAIVSYLGTENLETEHPDYVKYDLNRDGVIDSKDVAYVLASMDE